MDAIIAIALIVAILLASGAVIRLFDPRAISWRWLGIAATLVVLNDAMLTRVYGLIPRALSGFEWNWQGKIMALAATLAIAAFPAFGWRASGLAVAQKPGSLRASLPTVAAYLAICLAIGLAFPDRDADSETIAFQLIMPGLEEETFYRGVVLLALERAFTPRWRFLGIEWRWGALLSCALFGLAHAFTISSSVPAFEPLLFAATAIPALLAVWLRLRTGSVLLPIALHNFGNSIAFFG